jgi:uncharacterized Zn-finger protein
MAGESLSMTTSSRTPSNIELLASELNAQGGVYCPSAKAQMQLYSSHPKVYLDVARTGRAKCPYCGTVYALKAGEHFGTHH